MALGGLWHGAAWTFVLWGLFHGAWLVIHRTLTRGRTGVPRTPRWLRVAVTFHLVVAGFVLFRAPSLAAVGTVVEGLFAARPMSGPFPVGAALALLVGVATQALAGRVEPESWWVGWPRVAQGATIGAVILLIGLFGAHSQRFIYFQF